jgi:hypothetical protein
LPQVDEVEAETLKTVGNIFRWRVWGKVALIGISEFGEKVKYWNLFFSR